MVAMFFWADFFVPEIKRDKTTNSILFRFTRVEYTLNEELSKGIHRKGQLNNNTNEIKQVRGR